VSQIIWLPEALADVQRLFAFIEDKNPSAAARAAKTILNGANRLAEFPEFGHPLGDEMGRRELFVPFGAGCYVLRYILDDTAVVILRVWHSKEHRE
jgi:plasmid stabilization system protein ParE